MDSTEHSDQLVQQRALGLTAIEYIRTQLRQGGPLSRLVGDHVDLAEGTVVTMAPADCSEQQLYQFETGGKLGVSPDEMIYGDSTRIQPIPNTDPWVVATIEEFLRSGGEALCLLEDRIAAPTDPNVRSAEHVGAVEGTVYRMIFPEALELEGRVRSVLRAAMSHIMQGFLTRLASAGLISQGRKHLAEADLLEAARRTEQIVIPVYDLESYLLWTRTGSVNEDGTLT